MSDFGWYYYHFIVSEEFGFNIVFHKTDILGLVQKPYISISGLLPGKKKIRGSIQLSDQQVSVPKHAHTSDKSIVETDDDIRFNIVFNENISFQGVVVKNHQKVMLEDGVLCKDDNGFVNYWNVVCNGCKFSGRLVIDGQGYFINGYAYHDKQWGNLAIQNYVDHWFWFNFASNDASITCFYIVSKTKQVTYRTIVCKDGDLYATTNAFGIPERGLIQSTNKLKVTFDHKHDLNQVSLANLDSVRRRSAERYHGVSLNYHRQYGTSESTFGLMYGFAESMSFERCAKSSNCNVVQVK